MTNKAPLKRVLVAPLNWGLGHASRCCLLIDGLLEKNVEVIIASDGEALDFLKNRYPFINCYELPSYGVRYAKKGSQEFAVARQVPRILRTIKKEKKAVASLVQSYSPDLIISDNRYGVWHENIPSVFVCHQLAPIFFGYFQQLRKLIFTIHLQYMDPFSEIWVPDFDNVINLSGDLARAYPLPSKAKFIQPLSRFHSLNLTKQDFSHKELRESKPDIVAILSGPEPQRSILEELLLKEARKTDRSFWIVKGKPSQEKIVNIENTKLIPILYADDLALACKRAKVITSRSGYSSLMDFAALGLRKVILIPTPGQPEQKYLGDRMTKLGIAPSFAQENFSLEGAISKLDQFKGFTNEGPTFDKDALNKVLDEVLNLGKNKTLG